MDYLLIPHITDHLGRTGATLEQWTSPLGECLGGVPVLGGRRRIGRLIRLIGALRDNPNHGPVDPEEFNPRRDSRIPVPAGGVFNNLEYRLSYQRVELLRLLMHFVRTKKEEVTAGLRAFREGEETVSTRARGVVIGLALRHLGRTDLGADWSMDDIERLLEALVITYPKLSRDAEESQNLGLAEYWEDPWRYLVG